MATILKPPTPLPATLAEPSVFLAGSIEMGRALDWQQTVEAALDRYPATILNPRRDDWDTSWEQSIAHPQFAAQVRWELDAQVCVALCVALCAAGSARCAPQRRRRLAGKMYESVHLVAPAARNAA